MDEMASDKAAQISTPPPSVLVVDDDRDLSDMIVTLLQDSCKVTCVYSADEAQARILAEDDAHPLPELILLDIVLGAGSGYDLCREFKAHPATAHIPVIMMSSLTHSFDKVKAFQAGAVDFVTKPIDPAVLKMRIATHVKISRLQRHLEDSVRQRTDNLQKANEALRAMLKHRETEIMALEASLRLRIEKFISPYLTQLAKRVTHPEAEIYLDIIRSNLDELVTSDRNTLSAVYAKLTPAEVRVADLIRQGKQTKEIAQQLNLSIKSIYYYRNQIRSKLGLLNSKQNLSTFLATQTES